MTYEIIASGSTGNAVLIDDCILIDCGVPFSKLRPYLKNLKVVLLTHIHSDHFNRATLKTLHLIRPTLRFACCEWLVSPLMEAIHDERMIDILTPGTLYGYDLGDVAEYYFEPFELSHNVPQCGYRIFHHGQRFFYATDTANLTGIVAKDYDLYMIECNHLRSEIEAKIAEKQAAGEFAYEVEAARNHLSWEQAMDWLAENMGPKSQFIPMHQHVDKEKPRWQQENGITG